ncbi:L-selectin-like [Panulirus ornatus]|uniref:L-selectin-like n=1 Tax=Panulirus ornatus TaxID=150431 RepID=UPI003A86BBC4
MVRVSVFLLLQLAVYTQQQGLELPNPKACADRVNHSHTQRNGHHYFFSWKHRDTSNRRLDWFNARNNCRHNCQDLVSMETQSESKFVLDIVERENVNSVWTSGRKCNFDGCDEPHLQPININGWFWSANQKRMPPTNKKGGWRGDWSNKGGAGTQQPDNREGNEACLGILNNKFGDGVTWHDLNCNQHNIWICEDSQELLQYARSKTNLNIP